MAENVFASAHALLVKRGFAPIAVDNARASDPITLHSALREACRLHPLAWLPAYRDWERTTRPYTMALQVVRGLVAARYGREIDPPVWAARVGGPETLRLLADAARRHPNIVVKVLPELRRGCTAKVVGTLCISGVQIAAIKQLCESRQSVAVGRVVADSLTTSEVDLHSMTNDEFLTSLLAADPTKGGGDGPHRLSGTAKTALQALAQAASRRTEYRLPRLLAAIAESSGGVLPDLSDADLEDACRSALKRGSSVLNAVPASAIDELGVEGSLHG